LLRLPILHIELAAKPEPRILIGTIHNLQIHHKSPVNFEIHIGRFIQYSPRIFTDLDQVAHSASAISFKGKFTQVPLFDVGSANDIMENLVGPILFKATKSGPLRGK